MQIINSKLSTSIKMAGKRMAEVWWRPLMDDGNAATVMAMAMMMAIALAMAATTAMAEDNGCNEVVGSGCGNGDGRGKGDGNGGDVVGGRRCWRQAAVATEVTG
jgi:hypothetical protein